ncbi:MAG: hypothetical protein J0H45_05260, partial [Stenotrophomonas nitritireducens]|nr:hypothetical protein [Stenotrophomonas nitritireducens]
MSLPSDATPDAVAPAATAATAGTGLPTVDALLDEQPPADVDGGAPRYRLPQAAVPPTIMLQAAVARLVEQKERIDRLAREGLLDGLFPAEWSAVPGNELRAFVGSVVPFASDSVRGETIAARVPLKYLLGQSHRWGRDDVAEPRSLSAF